MSRAIDTLFRDTHFDTFRFDDQVAAVFDDMIRRSVPGYPLTLTMLDVLASTHAREGRRIYDLGCSLGAGMLAMLPAASQQHAQLIGIDNSLSMLQRCHRILNADARACSCSSLICADIRDMPIRDACMVVMNFTLQFIAPAARLPLLQRIRQGLDTGGILVLSEKIAFDDADEQQFQQDMHHAFKRQQGYSALEISRKRTALEHVLIPETLQHHIDRLQTAGFTRIHVWFQCFNFVSLVAHADA